MQQADSADCARVLIYRAGLAGRGIPFARATGATVLAVF